MTPNLRTTTVTRPARGGIPMPDARNISLFVLGPNELSANFTPSHRNLLYYRYRPAYRTSPAVMVTPSEKRLLYTFATGASSGSASSAVPALMGIHLPLVILHPAFAHFLIASDAVFKSNICLSFPIVIL